MGGDRQTGALLATPSPIMAKLVWDRLPQATARLLAVAQGSPLVEHRDRTSKGIKRAPSTGRTPAPYSALDARVGAISLRSVPPWPNFKLVQGELRECGPTPHWCQPQQPTVGPQHSLPDLKPKLTTMKVAQKKGWPEVTPVPFLNPDPIAHLVGCSNEAPVIVGGQ